MDDSPREWYAAARLCDKNCIANEAFRVLSQIVSHTGMTPMGTNVFWRLPVRGAIASTPPSCYAPTISMPSNPTPPTTPANPKTSETSLQVCFHCGKSGHLHPNCPRQFDIRYMSIEERLSFAQDEFAALDAVEKSTQTSEGREEEEIPGFGQDSD